MKKLKIEIPKGYVIDTEKSDTAKGEIYFKKAGLSYDEIVKELYNKGDFITENISLTRLCNVAKYLNSDWLPEDNMIKFYIASNGEELNIYDHSLISSSNVYFKSRTLAQQAISILGEEEIKKALTLNH